MPLYPAALPPAPAVHRRWCAEEHSDGETCLSATVTIPDLPFHVWAKTKHDEPTTIQIVIDTPTGAVVVEVPDGGTL